MTVTAVSSPITDAYLDALAATDRPVGDAQKPTGHQQLYPYCVFYGATVRMEGSLVDPHEDGLHRLQATVVGLTRKSVDYLCDLVAPILLDKTTAIDGHAVVWTESLPSPATQRDDDATPPVFWRAVVVNALITPDSSGS